MNIFILDKNPKIAAEMMCDKHVVKMIVESAQILSAVVDGNYKNEHRGLGRPSEQLGLPQYPKAHAKHPSTLWAKKSRGNYRWLIRHMRALCSEYRKRYEDRIHKLEGTLMIYEGQDQYLTFAQERRSPFEIAITNKEWHDPDPIKAYQTYYNMEKSRFAKWKLGNVPKWYVPGQRVA